MTDLSNVISMNAQSAITQQHKTAEHLVAFARACAQCAALLEDTPSLREVAFESLSNYLRGKTSIGNPDIIFLNGSSDDGQVRHSQSLTDALLQVLADGVNPFDDPAQGLYHRHDSVEPQHRVSDADFATIKNLFAQGLEALQANYQATLAKAWDNIEQISHGDFRSGARHQIVTDQHRLALEHEVEIQAIENGLNADEQKRLRHIFSHQLPKGLFKISLSLPEGKTAPLLSVFVIAQGEEVTDVRDAAGAFHLVMTAGGIERYESFSDLNSQLAGQLSMPSSRALLLKNMYLKDLDALPEGFEITEDDLTYERCLEPMLHCQVQALRRKQVEDFDFLVKRVRANVDDYPTFIEKVSAVQTCAHVDEAMGRHFKLLAARSEQSAQPDWLKHAEEDKREHHALLNRINRERKSVVDTLLAGMETLEVFARNEIDRYLRERLGYYLNPQNVMIRVPDEFDIQGSTFSVSYRKSLLEFAMQGLPTVAAPMQLDIPLEHRNPAITVDFVKTLIHDLDLPRRYRRQLRAQYTHETTLRALTHLRDSTLALSVWEAQLQGHLVDARSLALVHLVRGDNARDGADLSIGSLTLQAGGARFKDLLVFRDSAAGGDDHYVLYAPGAPGGRDMFEFPSWRHLSFEVGSWLRTQAGVRYVKDQTATTAETDHSDFLEKVRHKATLWNQQSVVFNELDGHNFEERLSDAITHKVGRTLAMDDLATLGLNTETSYAHRGLVALLDHRINELDDAFLRTTQDRVSFQAFARREGSKIINNYLRDQGFSQGIDTDTIYVDLENTAYSAHPDFSDSTHLKSLTELFMEGYSDNYAYKPTAPMYSSTGQDLRALPLYFVQFVDKALRDSALGERYMSWMQEEFLSPRHPQYGQRKALFGRHLQYDMRAAAMRDFLNGRLSAKQYQWLVQLIVSLDKQALAKDPGLQQRIKRSSAAVFRYAGHVVQGVYMLRDFSSSDGDFNLLYTPNAPDGVSFRKITDYVQLASSLPMRRYYYLRVSYKGQPSLGSLFDNMDRNIPTQWVDVEHLEHDSVDRISDIHELYDAQIQRIINDVDALTQSTAEHWVGKIYTVVRLLGSALLIPFPGAALAWTVLHMVIDLQRGLLAYHDGDRATASWFFGAAVFGSILGGAGAKTVIAHEDGLVMQVAKWALGKLATRIA